VAADRSDARASEAPEPDSLQDFLVDGAVRPVR
jgi:hypothetical protein